MELSNLQEAIKLVLMISMPPLVVSVTVGLGIGILQAATQLQEQSLSYVLKLVAMAGTLFLLAPWYCRAFSDFFVSSLSLSR